MCFAGKSRGSAGNAGSGMALFDSEGSELWWGHQQHGGASANEVDYISLVTGLKCALSLGVQRITALGCNALVFRQMEGECKVKKPSLKSYYDQAISLSKEFPSFEMKLVEKSLNERAVRLAKSAVDMQSADMSYPVRHLTILDEDKSQRGGFTSDSSSNTVVNVSLDPVSISPEKTYVMRFDGGSRGNPGSAGAGMVIYDGEDGCEIWSGCQYIGARNTNNEAEYMGLITGLQCALSLGVKNVVVQGDSQLILRQIGGEYKVKSPSLKPYHEQAVTLANKFASFQTSHIERARNARADELANEAMDTETSRGFNQS